jgi:catechol 2,3-dioxygenase-like lactoylglutathione lyase family enzyme
MLGDMTIRRMDNVGVVVDDLAGAIAFFVELGLELEGETRVEGSSVDRLVGLDDVRTDIALMRTPDGHSRVELMKFQRPTAVSAEPKNAPANTLGIRRIMFAVDDIEDVVARLRAHGAQLVGELGSPRTNIASVTSAALTASSSRWPSRSAEAFDLLLFSIHDARLHRTDDGQLRLTRHGAPPSVPLWPPGAPADSTQAARRLRGCRVLTRTSEDQAAGSDTAARA